MEFIRWKPEYAIGYIEIDDQHKVLIERLNKLLFALSKNKNQSILISIYNELFEEIDKHIFTEEKLMYVNQYPNYERHSGEHMRIKKILHSIKERASTQHYSITQKTIKKIHQLLIDHFQKSDKPMGEYFQLLFEMV